MNQLSHSPPLEPNSVYHIFTHAVEHNNLFENMGNYTYFLEKWQLQTEGYFKTYAFCLMPNHLHFCIQTATESDLLQLSNQDKPIKEEEDWNDKILSQRVSNCLNGYSQAFNKQQDRKGTLFRSRFGRIKIDNKQYFKDAICYTHHNPIHHFNADGYADWAFSSYNMFIKGEHYETLFGLCSDTVIRAFGDLDNFKIYHEEYRQQKKYVAFEAEIKKY